MAHEIMNNEIAYVGETPWHGIGHKVPVGTTGEEMLTLAGLNWPVEYRTLSMQDASGNLIEKPLANFQALVRGDNNTVFNVASKRYQIVQNLEVVNLFREYCAAGSATMETVGALRGGAVIWALARLNGGTKATIGGCEQDKVEGYILFCTSHDGTLQTIGTPTQVRVVCANTMRAAIGNGKSKYAFKLKHSTKWTEERASEAKTALGMAIENIQAFNELSSQLAQVKIDRKGQIEFISALADGKCLLDLVADNTTQAQQVAQGMTGADVLASLMETQPTVRADFQSDDSKLNRVGKAILDSIIDSPGSNLSSAAGTLWGAVNGVSYYTDHQASRNQDNRLYNSWFGLNQQLKTSAIETACNMAGIKAN